MTNKKITKKDRFNEMIAIFDEMGRADLADFAKHELELLAKKNAGKSKVSQAEQEKRDNLANAVIEILTENGKPMANADIGKAMPDEFGVVSTQKLTPILAKLVENGMLIAEKVKGRTFYSVV
jgi:uncharacterized protein YqeY